jgi:hypothetical protein
VLPHRRNLSRYCSCSSRLARRALIIRIRDPLWRTAMAHEQHPESSAEAQQDESVFGVGMIRVFDDQGVFVQKRGLRLFERHVVLLEIRLGLAGIPGEPEQPSTTS